MIDQTNLAQRQRCGAESAAFRPSSARCASPTAVTYDLPIGAGRPVNLQSRLFDRIFGGWKIASTYQFQVGGPLTWLNGSTNNPGDYVYLGGKLDSQPRNVDGQRV